MASTSSATPDADPVENLRVVTLSVVSQVKKTLTFNIKGNVPLKKLVDMYFREVPTDRRTVDFIYNGKRLGLHLTPDQLGMADEDEIEVMTRVDGGCSHFCSPGCGEP